MTDQEILKQAIEKAIHNGFSTHIELITTMDRFMKGRVWFAIIFSHDFAKAFWGEERHARTYQGEDGSEAVLFPLDWKFYLTQMVLEEEPLRYLEQFLDSGQEKEEGG